MTKNKRPSVLEVAKILRNYKDHKLNRKIYKNFDKDDFDGIYFIQENGYPRPQDIIKDKEAKVYKLEASNGDILEFESVSEIAEFFEFKALSYWRRYVAENNYKVID
jgi:hypothetical protein